MLSSGRSKASEASKSSSWKARPSDTWAKYEHVLSGSSVPGREQLGARVRRDLEAARLQVDARQRHAVDREGAAQDLQGLLGGAQLARQRSDAQGSSSKTSMTS